MKKQLWAAAALLLALLPTALTAQDSAWYMGKPISAVEFTGLRGVDRRDLDGITKKYLGKPFSNELFLELQSAITDLDYFESMEPSALPGDAAGTTVIVQFAVKEKPLVGSVSFKGNSSVKDYELSGAVTLKAGDLVSKAAIAADEDALRLLYIGKGFTSATVSSQEVENPKGGTDIVFVIDEGRMIAVKKIAITGNSVFSEKTLKGTISLKEAGLFQAGVFQEDKLAQSRQALLDYYLDRGYIDAKVLDVQRSYEPDPKKAKDYVTLTFVVQEGKQFIYRGLSFEGNEIFSTDKLKSLVLQKEGQPFNKSKFMADFDRVRNLYYENGYVFNQIEPAFSKDDAGLTVSVAIKITERDRAHISSIVIKGNEKTKDSVIRREIPLEEGDIFSKKKIEEGFRNLSNLQYFSSIVPDVVPVSEQLVDLVLNVTEQSTAGFNIGMSYVPSTGKTASFPIGGFLKWNDSNFLGNGQNFATDLEFNTDEQSLTFSFTEPWMLGIRWLGGVNFSFSHTLTSVAQDILGPIFPDGVPDPYSSYEEYAAANFKVPAEYMMDYNAFKFGVGGSTGYLFKMGFADLGVKLGANSTLEDLYYDKLRYRPYSQDIRDNLGVWKLQDTFTFYTYLDGLDLSYNPSKGYVVTNRATLAGFLPFETQHYIQDDFKVQFYATLFNVPVTDNWRFKGVLGLSSSYSGLFPEFSTPMAVKTGSYLKVDGMMTMRGWNDLSTFDATGIFYNWAELRIPISEQYLWLDTFLDAAVVQTSTGLLAMSQSGATVDTGKWMLDMGRENWAFSVGAMLRLTIPNFPLRFGIAKKFILGPDGPLGLAGDLFHSSTDAASGLSLILSLNQAPY